MSLSFASNPLRSVSGRMSCQVCRSTLGNTARRQWQASRSIHLPRATTYTATLHAPPHQFSRSLQPSRRLASTTPIKSGPTINIPEFPSHNRAAPAAPQKHEVHGTVPSFQALKADEDWGEDTELVDADEAKIFVTDPALAVCVLSLSLK
jgi:hypothetical protein